MSSLKIVFVTADKQIVIYGQGLRQLWQVESYVLEHLGEVLSQMQQEVQRANIRKYWIDDEGDQVEILNDVDYDFFLKRVGPHKTPKIYFQAVVKPAGEQQPQQPQESQQPPNTENMAVHETVSCDVCLKCPIVGFRYKCLECNNYDICMKCEGEMKHKDHLMLRIPTYGSSIASTGCPAAVLFGSRRRQKKYAAACAAAAASTDDGGQGDGKPRHYRHHRRHCGSGTTPGSGVHHILSNFYDMMQGLAEGGGAPQTASAPESPEKTPASVMKEAAAEAAAGAAAVAAVEAMKAAEAANLAAATAAAGPSTSNTQSKETNTSPDRSANAAPTGQEFRTGSASAPPSFENLQNFIDPQFMKAGIQILNNFSEMFGKILEPAVVTDATRPSSTATSVAADIDLTGNDSRASASPQTGTGNATPDKASTVASGNVTPMDAEPSSPPHTPSSSPRAEENDWTMIDNSLPGLVVTNAAESSSRPTDPASIAAAVASASQPLDFTKLSQQLQSHIENEKNTPVPVVPSPSAPAPAVITLPAVAPIPLPPPITVQTQTSAPTPDPTPVPVPVPVPVSVPAAAQPPTERRAVAVYHPDQRINTAIHAMMAMGFSNEGAMLTQLLESVNGDIPLALDLMTNAQRT